VMKIALKSLSFPPTKNLPIRQAFESAIGIHIELSVAYLTIKAQLVPGLRKGGG